LRLDLGRVPCSAIAIVDEAQAFEGEAVVDFGDVLRLGGNEVRKAPGGNAFCLGAELGDHALENRVDQTDVAPKQANLEIVDGVGSDDLGGAADFHARQTRGAGEQRLCRDVEAGGDRSAEKFALAGDNVEVGGRAKVDDDGGSSIFVKRADAVGDAIGANF